MSFNFNLFLFYFPLFVTVFTTHDNGTPLKELTFKFPSDTFGETAFLEYVKGRAHFDVYFHLPVNETIKAIFKTRCQGKDQSDADFKRYLGSEFDMQLALFYLMHKHWQCAKIGTNIGQIGQTLCLELRANLDKIYEFILSQYYNGSADQSLVDQFSLVVKPKFEANGHILTLGQVIESLNQFSSLFFNEQKIDVFEHFLKRFSNDWNLPNLVNDQQIKFVQSLGQFLKEEKGNNKKIKAMADQIKETLKNDQFFDIFNTKFCAEFEKLEKDFKQQQISKNGQIKNAQKTTVFAESDENLLLRKNFDKKLAQIVEKVKESLEKQKNLFIIRKNESK